MNVTLESFLTEWYSCRQEKCRRSISVSCSRVYETKRHKPKSELGLQLQNLYRQKGFTAQHQLTLADDYESNTQVINSFSERIKALSMNSEAQFTRADFDSDAEFQSVKAFYNRKNALFVDAIAEC